MARIAVIAVHGVGSPPQFETARGVADLLTQHGSRDAAPGTPATTYDGFLERFVTIPTAPVVTAPPAGAAASPRTTFAVRAKQFAPGARDRTTFDPNDETAVTDLDVAFMRNQLAGYDTASDHPPYSTIELTGTRTTHGVATSKDHVHVFEMHWADLSRVGSGLLSVLGGLYQLVLHVAHLGRKSLDLAAASSELRPKSADEPRRWKQLATLHTWMVRLFTIAVPASTMLLFACVALFLPDVVSPANRLTATLILGGSVGLVALGVIMYFFDRSPRAATKFVAAMFAAATTCILLEIFEAQLGGDRLGTALFGGTSVVLVVAMYLFVINRYDASAPGALSWGLGALAVALGGTAYWAPRFVRTIPAGEAETLRFAALSALQWSYIVLIVAWTAIWLCALIAAWFGFRLRRTLRAALVAPFESRARGLRALWTSRVTLAAALFGYLGTALVFYQALTVLAWRVHAKFNVFPTIAKHERFPLVSRWLVPPHYGCPRLPRTGAYDGASCAKRFFEGMIAQSGTVGLPVALATLVVTTLMISWFIALVAVTSVHRPKSLKRYAERVGAWISDGFRWMRRAGSVLVIGLTLALTVGVIASSWMIVTGEVPRLVPGLSPDGTRHILNALAVAALASAATIAAAKGRLDLIAARTRPALGIILDVDNYLRESPTTGTPRAMIAERFASLLRHVVERKDALGNAMFDHVVIVSHSQGTVIAADLLRFLTVAEVASPDLATRDIRLMTMGSPLRQLYAVNFPYLYDWIDRTDAFGDGVADDDDVAFAARGIAAPLLAQPPAGVATPLSGVSPSPSWLRVTRWVNLYTSGDYVGRSIWQTDSTPGVWSCQEVTAAVQGVGRRERCLGDGTHTRYWTSKDVAVELDMLIG
jgi:hypothetical protein